MEERNLGVFNAILWTTHLLVIKLSALAQFVYLLPDKSFTGYDVKNTVKKPKFHLSKLIRIEEGGFHEHVNDAGER